MKQLEFKLTASIPDDMDTNTAVKVAQFFVQANLNGSDIEDAGEILEKIGDFNYNKNTVVTVKTTYTFGDAIEALKKGHLVARLGWNGKGMFLWLKQGAQIKAENCQDPRLKRIAITQGGEVIGLPTICMKTADDKVLTGWLASQTDILADDWIIVPIEHKK